MPSCLWVLNENSAHRTGAADPRVQNKLFPKTPADLLQGTNDFVCNLNKGLVDPQEPLLTAEVKLFGQVVRHNTLAKTVLRGYVEGSRHRGKQNKC